MNGDLITGTHPYADKFPMLTDAELDELAQSIATIGLLNPITVERNGLIIDGRNRLEACNRAEVEARVEVYEGDDIAEFVIASNVTRRNQTTGQRAMCTALVLEADGRRDNGRWRRGSMDTANQEILNSDWRNKITQCGIILDFKPDLAAAVISGAITLNDAFTQAEAIRTSAERDKIMEREKAKREKQEAAADAARNAEIVADLTQAGAQKYLDMVNAGAMTPKAAWAAHREDTRKEREQSERERRALSQQFGDIANALRNLGTWGAYDDPASVMSDLNPDDLNPPMLFRFFDLDNLEAAHRMTTTLIAWRKSYVR